MFTFPSLEAPDIRHVHDNIVHHSKLPQQPIRYLSRGLTDNMWTLMGDVLVSRAKLSSNCDRHQGTTVIKFPRGPGGLIQQQNDAAWLSIS